jgi:hypothetical protein
MKSSLILATVFVATAGAMGAGATAFTTSPYQGSDTEFNIQNQAIENSTLGNTNPNWTPQSASGNYAGGGSGAGESAMAANPPTQQTAPMSRMLKGGAGANACASTNNLAQASGIVIGVDAARVFASTAVIALVDAGAGINNASICNGGLVSQANACTLTKGGLVYDTDGGSGTLSTYSACSDNGAACTSNANCNGAFDGGPAATCNTVTQNNPFQNWRDALALLYGGLDKVDGICSDTGSACNPYNGKCASGATCNPVTNCLSARRQALINSWGTFFENTGCTNPNGTTLTHAFRRDDNSGTADVFSNLLGMQSASVDQYNNPIAGYSVSSEAAHSFGTTPYCNSLNWDTAEVSAKKCTNEIDQHYEGPGGQPLSATIDPNCAPSSTGGVRASTGICHHVPPFVCGAALLCPNGNSCTTAGAACPAGGVCAAGQDNRCPVGEAITLATYGSVNFGTQAFVFPTSYQDNDPIRTKCLGNGDHSPSEDVCNTDGKLGVVLPIPPLDFVPDQNTQPNSSPPVGLGSFTGGPTAATTCQTIFPNSIDPGQNVTCGGAAVASAAPVVATCAPKGLTGTGACPNNDQPLSIGCLAPTGAGTLGATTSCWSDNSVSPGCFFGQNQTGGTPCGVDGRVYNEQIYNGVGAAGATAAYVTFTVGGVALDDVGGYGRIHQKDTSLKGLPVCHLGDAALQIGCLVQADPMALGYAGNTGDVWEAADPLGNGTCSGETTGLRVHELAAGTLCTPVEPPAPYTASYPLWHKLYMNSIVGFANVTSADELMLSQWESIPQDIGTIMGQYGEFPLQFSPNTAAPNLGDGGAGGAPPFCEDFNEYNAGCAPDGGAGNLNGCFTNIPVSPIPYDLSNNAGADAAVFSNDAAAGNPPATISTVCGNGLIEDYEDCDPGTASVNGSPAVPAAPLPAGCGSCSTLCRCSL